MIPEARLEEVEDPPPINPRTATAPTARVSRRYDSSESERSGPDGSLFTAATLRLELAQGQPDDRLTERALNRSTTTADERSVEASAYALVHGVRCTRATLVAWRGRPWPVLRRWLIGALVAAGLLLTAVLTIALITPASGGSAGLGQPPFAVGDLGDLVQILRDNMLVLALHAMACVAGFMAGSSLPLQAEHHTGFVRVIHERGQPFAMAFVVCATGFSLSLQAYTIGTAAAHDAAALHVSPAVLLLGLLPHALPELVALFLPLAAWIVASRRGEWERLLAATLVTVSLAVPTLVLAAAWEVYIAPHILAAILS